MYMFLNILCDKTLFTVKLRVKKFEENYNFIKLFILFLKIAVKILIKQV